MPLMSDHWGSRRERGNRQPLRKQRLKFEPTRRQARGWIPDRQAGRGRRGIRSGLALAGPPFRNGEEAFDSRSSARSKGVRLGVERKFGLGWSAPVCSWIYIRHSGAGQGRGLRLRAGSLACPRLADRGKSGRRRSLRASVVFARTLLIQRPRRCGFPAGLTFSRNTFACGFLFRHGDVVSYATLPGQTSQQSPKSRKPRMSSARSASPTASMPIRMAFSSNRPGVGKPC
jgi:hypothetical protein